jgi:hypothetical protein
MHAGLKCGNLWREDNLEDVGLDGRIILILIFILSYKVEKCGLD